MKSLFKTFLSFTIMSASIWTSTSVSAQTKAPLIPGKNSFQKKWLKNETNQMTWYVLRDTVKTEIGKVSNQIVTDKKFINIVTMVSLKNTKTTWVDSTSADIKTLKPIRHASYNMQRDMVLNFGQIVSGLYNDKIKQQNIVIKDTTTEEYFDSNIYPSLIRWLPLKEGYKKEISIYDYNPSAKIGVIKAYVKRVSSGTYKSSKSGIRHVWIVNVNDEIGNQPKGSSTYYIDKSDRKLWKQENNAAGRTMVMECIE